MSPFTVVLCWGCAHTDDLLLNRLRETVRECPHGVLISAGCVHGPLVCGRAQRPAGAVVTAQDCTGDRRPVGAAVCVGPIRTEADVLALCRWLRGDDHSPELLPARLLRPPPYRMARLN
jgi:hypothetical protein